MFQVTAVRIRSVLTILLLATATTASAEDAYFAKPVGQLDFTRDKLPRDPRAPEYRNAQAYAPYVVLDGEGEAFLSFQNFYEYDPIQVQLAVRVPHDEDVKGALYWPDADENMVRLQFRIPASEASIQRKNQFLEYKSQHYRMLLQRDIPGSAWFRHELNAVERQRGNEGSTDTGGGNRRFFGRRGTNMEDTFALVSGGRALSENLQLDRVLPAADAKVATVAMDEIEGITVREYEWDVEKLDPAVDVLTRYVPEDQHVLLFPSFQAMVDLADQADEQGTPVLNLAQPRSETARSRQRYEKQLGISLNAGARLLGPQLVESVAMTGGDPYFRTGTDVAILFEAKNAAALRQLLETQIQISANDNAAVEPQNGTIEGLEYNGFRSPDRSVCSYVAVLDNVVVVTNSLAQLERLAKVATGKQARLADLDEYTFFRDRYPKADSEETALLLISDATIRRWCGPRWRIGTSRRTRAVAAMAELQAANLDRLVAGKVSSGPIYADQWQPVAGELMLSSNGVYSKQYGSLDFQTPILELDLDYATEQEEQLYEGWRDGYQRNWSNFFDPIAIRFHASQKRLAADVTVMPLISNSRYDQFISISRGAKIDPQDGDPHKEALIHLAMALNHDSPLMQQGASTLSMFAPQVRINPLSWLGDTVAVYAENSDVWNELTKAEDKEEFLEQNFHRIPVAVYFEVSSGIRLTAFLAGVRGFIEQSAPGMTVWETKEHGEQPYVKVSPSARARADEPDFPEEFAVYYAASGDFLLVTINEDLLKNALDRYAVRQQTLAQGKEWKPDGPQWLGENLCLQIDRRVLEFFELISAEEYQRLMQGLAWSNLPILNEWKRLYPDQDPVALHEQFWQARLLSPGGGTYRWNEKWQTMESTDYGHPGQPKSGPPFPEALRSIARGNFGLTFEEDGLRTQIELRRRGR